MLKDKKVVIFDMDGTLIDSVGMWNQVDMELMKTLGGESADEEAVQKLRDEKLAEYSSMPEPYIEYCSYIARMCGSDMDGESVHTLRYEIADNLLRNNVDYKPGADVLIKKLHDKGYILAIATTTRKKNMDIYRNENKNIMAKAPIDEYFSVVYCREDVSHIKPDPEVFLKVTETLAVESSECIIFEDSLTGVLAANSAGIDVVSVYDIYSRTDREKIIRLSDYSIMSFGELDI